MSIEDYQCHENVPRLLDRIKIAMVKLGGEYPDTYKDIIGCSVPIEYLDKFSRISCMRCYFCNNEELQKYELSPILLWTYGFLYVFDESSDYGDIIVVYGKGNWQKDQVPLLFESGKKIYATSPIKV